MPTPRPQFRLRSLVLAVIVCALALAAGIQTVHVERLRRQLAAERARADQQERQARVLRDLAAHALATVRQTRGIMLEMRDELRSRPGESGADPDDRPR